MSARHKDLVRAATRLGCQVELDDPSQCYRVTAPHGRRFEGDLHELIGLYGDGIIGDGGTKLEARADLVERLADYREMEVCDDPQCDWCKPE